MCTFAAHKGGSSFRIELEGGCLEVVGKEIQVTRPGSKEAETVPLDEVPDPMSSLLDCVRDYIEKDEEPHISGRQNLTTVAMVEAMGVASDEARVIDFDEYMQRPCAG